MNNSDEKKPKRRSSLVIEVPPRDELVEQYLKAFPVEVRGNTAEIDAWKAKVEAVRAEEMQKGYDRLVEIRRGRLRLGRRAPSVAKVAHLIDLLPGPRLRKTMRKLIADQASHIDELNAAGRFGVARLQVAMTWALVVVNGVMHVVNMTASALRGRWRGS